MWGSTINHPYRIMRQIEMRRVKRGEFFRLANSESAPVWVRDEYNRSSKKIRGVQVRQCELLERVQRFTPCLRGFCVLKN